MRIETLDITPCMEDAKNRFERHSDLPWYSFPQMWGSTALGFGGMGGATMTTAQTVVIGYGCKFVVYFGTHFAYEVNDPNTDFFDDMKEYKLRKVSEAGKYMTRSDHGKR